MKWVDGRRVQREAKGREASGNLGNLEKFTPLSRHQRPAAAGLENIIDQALTWWERIKLVIAKQMV